jgi:hypothetical protein
MNSLSFIDTYTIRARLFPAIIAGAPVIALAAILVSWDRLGLPHLIATIALGVLLFVLSDVARRRGRAIEPGLIERMGGLPSIVILRHQDPTFDEPFKVRALKFLASKIGGKPPTAAEEQKDPDGADNFYARCGNWLREHTRDTKKFKILFEENITYGFRRNLYGLKWPALILNAAIVALCLVLLSYRLPFDLNRPLTAELLSVLVIAFLHAAYLTLFVTETGVKEASRQYARQLILSCEVLQTSASAAKAKAKP